MKTVNQLIVRIKNLYNTNKNDYVVGITVTELNSLVSKIEEQKTMLMNAENAVKKQKSLADAILANALLEQEKFTVLERV